MTEQELWQAVLNDIELQTSRANFVTWFRNTYISSRRSSVVFVAVPNGFTKEWLENKYHRPILKALRNITSEIKEVRYVIENKKPMAIHIPIATPAARASAEEGRQLAFEEFQVNKLTNLNPKYGFESFVVGPSNELAYAAALSVVKNPGLAYNPLFIYGGVGLGKTHLLQSIGNELSKHKKVLYLTSEKFTNDFIYSVQNKTIEAFKDKYRKKDVLIIDDIQFIAGKEQTQEEFFHTFNTLHEHNKQIILSSDRPPKAIPTLEERLRSRFEGGMLVDIGAPDYETRLAILKTKAKEREVDLPDEVFTYIANNIKKNVRELEGALNLVVASSRLASGPISAPQTKRVLAHLISKPQKPITYKQILKTVSTFYEIQEKDLMGKNRKQEVVLPRQVAMFLMRDELKGSYPHIGSRFGGRDHTTVMHACVKIESRLRERSEFEEEVNLIKQQLYNNA
ncbi:MAG: chromosomal replication initiator protein DnaA [Candidatus Spechtbacterales bacterium]